MYLFRNDIVFRDLFLCVYKPWDSIFLDSVNAAVLLNVSDFVRYYIREFNMSCLYLCTCILIVQIGHIFDG